ncbi:MULTISPECIES: hypothetical protein [Aminobacter]|uniref:hypothetical protein n=1 Tax=Aminobacter TaxID=31988 RepID=UPI000D5051F9|nr:MULTISPECIES: hypothetical protein [Aminobacter]AWC25620.1 hypothetical protein CO731_05119 [Aminobacter sp. MSH1]CAI2936269.1 conserved protein of unknown function [Aminobacter niigataensis]
MTTEHSITTSKGASRPECNTSVLDAEDAIFEAKNLVQCLFLAVHQLPKENMNPLATTLNFVSIRLDDALTCLSAHGGKAEGGSA